MNFLVMQQTCKLNGEERKNSSLEKKKSFIGLATGANAIKKFTPILAIPYLGV